MTVREALRILKRMPPDYPLVMPDMLPVTGITADTASNPTELEQRFQVLQNPRT